MLMIGVLFQKMFFMIDIEMEGCYYYYMDEFIKIIVFVIEWLILFYMIDIVMSIQFYIIIRLILVIRICMICVDYILQKVFFMIGIGVIVYYYFFMDYVIIRGIFFMWNCYVIDIVLLIFFFFYMERIKNFQGGEKEIYKIGIVMSFCLIIGGLILLIGIIQVDRWM